MIILEIISTVSANRVVCQFSMISIDRGIETKLVILNVMYKDVDCMVNVMNIVVKSREHNRVIIIFGFIAPHAIV